MEGLSQFLISKQLITCSVSDQPNDHLIDHLIHYPIDHMIDHLIDHPIDHMIDHLIDHLIHYLIYCMAGMRQSQCLWTVAIACLDAYPNAFELLRLLAWMHIPI